LWKARDYLKEHHTVFHPGMNEDLAATSIWGTQQVNLFEGATYDGVFGMWYGKGPGVDRSGDAIKHGNAYGSSPHGGVLVVLGDDHGCVSSSLPHQSEQALMAWSMPVLNRPISKSIWSSAPTAGPCRAFPATGSASRRFRKPWKAAR